MSFDPFCKNKTLLSRYKNTCSVLRVALNILCVLTRVLICFYHLIYLELKCQECKPWGEGIFSFTLHELSFGRYTVFSVCNIFLEHVKREIVNQKICVKSYILLVLRCSFLPGLKEIEIELAPVSHTNNMPQFYFLLPTSRLNFFPSKISSPYLILFSSLCSQCLCPHTT